MVEYLYKATTLSGQTVEGAMDGKDEEMIIQSLHQLGYIPIRIVSHQEKGTGFRLPSFLRQRVGVKNLLAFTQELSTLISAGLPLDRSLSILGTLTENDTLRETVKDVLKKVEGGNSLAEALGNYPRIFPKALYQYGQGRRVRRLSGDDPVPVGAISSRHERDQRPLDLRNDLSPDIDRLSQGSPSPFWSLL